MILTRRGLSLDSPRDGDVSPFAPSEAFICGGQDFIERVVLSRRTGRPAAPIGRSGREDDVQNAKPADYLSSMLVSSAVSVLIKPSAVRGISCKATISSVHHFEVVFSACPRGKLMNSPRQVGIEGHKPLCEPEILDGPWHVLRTRSNFEKRVAQHLAMRAIEHYLPLYRDRVKWTDRTVLTERPLFLGYVFARYSAKSRIVVLSTPGVVSALGDEPGDLVANDELDRIREGLSSGLLLRPHPRISAGTQVRIREGVFTGVQGVVAEFRQQCKVVISIAAARQFFSIEVDSSVLEIVKPYPT